MVLSKTVSVKMNVTQQEQKALKKFLGNSELTVKRVVKAGKIVLLNTSDYNKENGRYFEFREVHFTK